MAEEKSSTDKAIDLMAGEIKTTVTRACANLLGELVPRTKAPGLSPRDAAIAEELVVNVWEIIKALKINSAELVDAGLTYQELRAFVETALDHDDKQPYLRDELF